VFASVSGNLEFIKSVRPDNIILVHGEKKQMERLKDRLVREVRTNWPTQQDPFVANPENTKKVRIRFLKQITADIVGSAAVEVLEGLESGAGGRSSAAAVVDLPRDSVLVTENFVSKVVTASELQTHTSFRLGSISQRMLVPVPLNLAVGLVGVNTLMDTDTLLTMVLPYLTEVFDTVVHLPGTNIQVEGVATITVGPASAKDMCTSLVVEWVATPGNDMIADCTVGILLQALSAPNLLKMTMMAQVHSDTPNRTVSSYKP
jgi:Pre-mRNA 3'-end-processing endonuclease polyadenylation factor C-term/Zn-dependent metallo-hydrolase RNA specificity domain